MKKKEEILNGVMLRKGIPEGYNLVESYCHLLISELMVMYRRGEITKEQATKEKERILGEYEKEVREWEFKEDLYKKHIESIKRTECSRMKLRELLRDGEEVTEGRMAEVINVAMSIIMEVFPVEFKKGEWR